MALTAAGVAFTQHAYEHDPAARSFGLEAAEVLGLPPEQVFKTLLSTPARPWQSRSYPWRVSSTSRRWRRLGAKRVTMADPVAAQRSSGYVVGGISPIGQKRALPTVVDESAELFDVVYVSGGRRGLDLGLSPTDLVRVTGAVLADIGR